MPKYPFLSPEWIAAAKALADEAGANAPADGAGHGGVNMNQIITDVPFGEGTLNMHMANGGMGEGHVDGADVTLSLDYETAKAIFVGGDPQAGMQAFMAGKIKVQGDMSKLMAMGQGGAPGGGGDLQKKLAEITE